MSAHGAVPRRTEDQRTPGAPSPARPVPCVRDLLAAGAAVTAISTPPEAPGPQAGPGEEPEPAGPGARDAA